MPRRRSAGSQQTTMGTTCKCSKSKGVLGGIVAAIGVLIAVQGFALQLGLNGQWGDTTALGTVLIHYIIGFVIIGAAKCMGGHCHGAR